MTTTAPETTATTETTGTEFYVRPAALDRALRMAQLHASKDNTLPVLCSVALTVTDNGNLVAQATDRYTLGMALVETVEEQPANLEALKAEPAIIPTAALPALYAWLKPHLKGPYSSMHFHVTITPAGHGEHALNVTNPADGTRSTLILLSHAQFPKISSLLRPWSNHSDLDRIALSPHYLERAAKMGKLGCEKNSHMEMSLGSGLSKPVNFRGHTDGKLMWECLLMPVSRGMVEDDLNDATQL